MKEVTYESSLISRKNNENWNKITNKMEKWVKGMKAGKYQYPFNIYFLFCFSPYLRYSDES